MKRFLAAWTLVAASAVAGRAADSPGKAVRVEYADDTLSVHAEAAPLSSVLAEVARATGCRISGSLEEPRPVSVDFHRVPVEDALRRLLGDQPFAARYARDHLSAIELVDRGKGVEPVVVYPTPARPISRGAPPMIPVSGALAARVGAPSAPLPTIMTMALADQDAATRAAASTALVSALDKDRGLQDEFVATYGRMTEQALAQLAGAMPGAGDFFEYLRAHTRSDELRQKANGVLRELRGSAPSADGGQS